MQDSTTAVKTRAARKLLISAALDLTRLKRKMRRACMMVLLEDRTQSEAARRVGRSRKTINKALRVLQPKLEQVRHAFEESR